MWSCDLLARPTFRNLTDSFESWAYRHGLRHQLAQLERRKFLESQVREKCASGSFERVVRLTEEGRLHALGGRDPDVCWRQPWDGVWRIAVFDLPQSQASKRDQLRNHLKKHGFGCLQRSVWITPHPLHEHRELLLKSRVDAESLVFFEAQPCAGETSQELVTAAWDFEEINEGYKTAMKVLKSRPKTPLRNENAARIFRNWADNERDAWAAAVAKDPLLPASLNPRHYLGRKAWELRSKVLRCASTQLAACRLKLNDS